LCVIVEAYLTVR